MNTDLLLLSGQIALLVLVASVLAALIVWSWCRLGTSAARKAAAESELKATAAEQAAEAARAAHATAEQQCFTALEHRDEAERQALERSAEARRLTDQLASLQLNSIARDEHQRLLAVATERLHDQETGNAARVDELRATVSRLESEHTQAIEQRDALNAKLTDAERRLQEVEATNAARLDELRMALSRLEAEHAQAIEVRDAQAAKLADAERRLHEAEVTSAAQLDELHTVIARLKTESTQVAEERDALAAKLEASTQQHASALAELEQRHANEVQAWQSKLDAASAESQRLQLTLDNANALRAGIEHDLRTAISQLKAQPAPAPAAAPVKLVAPAPVPVKAPVIEPVPTPPAPVESPPVAEDEPFPMAPMAPVRASTLHHRLFKGPTAAPVETAPPNLEPARERLASMESEGEDVRQRLATAQAEVAQLAKALEQQQIDEPSAADKHKVALRHLKEAQQRATQTADDHERLQRHIRALRRSLATLEGRDLKADDLTQLKGVKTVLNQQLHSFGIYTYRQIVAWDAEDILAFGELLSFKQRITRDKWQEQARQLHEAHYGERLM